MVYHSRHCSVIDTSTSPIKKLWESSKGMGEHHVNDRNPEAECKKWLLDNGYLPIEGSQFWEMGKKVIVRWSAFYETTIVVPQSVSLDSQLVKDEAANINIDVPGSTYQTDTWEIEKIVHA